MIAVGMVLMVSQLAGCSSSNQSELQNPTERVTTSGELVPGYAGGCEEGFVLYVQNQYTPYGSLIRRSLDFDNTEAESGGLHGNDELRAIGWTDTGRVFYEHNPEGLRGNVWFYIPELPNDAGPGWLPDTGVRAVLTQPSPGNRDEDFDPKKQAAPQTPQCELLPR